METIITNGWLNINKPLGLTSSRIVSIVKKKISLYNSRKLKIKVGHVGTLDPLASGVLPIAIGEATKLSDYIVGERKKYSFTIQFGEQRNTGDAEGIAIFKTDYIPSLSEVDSIISNFIGKQKQIPPKYSAIKVNGRRAYELARNKIDFDLKMREIYIDELTLIAYDQNLGQAKFEVSCSKGTYIRVLAEDIAKSLHSYGFVIMLCRLEVGNFKLTDSIDFDNFIKLFDCLDNSSNIDRINNSIKKIETALDDILVLDINDTVAKRIHCGQKCEFLLDNRDLIWLRNNDKLQAIGSIQDGMFHSNRVFNL